MVLTVNAVTGGWGIDDQLHFLILCWLSPTLIYFLIPSEIHLVLFWLCLLSLTVFNGFICASSIIFKDGKQLIYMIIGSSIEHILKSTLDAFVWYVSRVEFGRQNQYRMLHTCMGSCCHDDHAFFSYDLACCTWERMFAHTYHTCRASLLCESLNDAHSQIFGGSSLNILDTESWLGWCGCVAAPAIVSNLMTGRLWILSRHL